MKKLTLLIVLLLSACLLFAACVQSDNESSPDERAISAESSVAESASNAESSDIAEDSVASDSLPEFDQENVIYNPDEEHYREDTRGNFTTGDLSPNFFYNREPSDKLTLNGGDNTLHSELDEYINGTEIPENAWFCVHFSPELLIPSGREYKDGLSMEYMVENIESYLESLGVVFDKELSAEYTAAYDDGDVFISNGLVGYITEDMLWKIQDDGFNLVIIFNWLPEKCITEKQCIVASK